MSLRKATAAGTVAVALVAAGGIAFVAWVTEDAAPGGRRQAAVEVAPSQPQPASEPPLLLDPRGLPSVGLPPPAPEFVPIDPAVKTFTPAAPRRLPRGTAPPVDLLTSLAQARVRILGCAGLSAGDDAVRPRGAPVRAPAQQDRTVLLLDLEPAGGEVTVLEATVQLRGHASDRLLTCAQQDLVGSVLPASAARPGQRFKMQFPLDPPGR